PLLLTSQTGICISSVLVVVGSLHGYNVLVVVSVLLFVSSFAIGLGPIPYLIIPEILPTHCVSSGGSICLGLNWLCAFLVGLTFPALQSVLGGYTFLVFAVITAVSGFASVFIPEV
ncbi:13094_t:CDS:2, partial [Acaulospora morrowiae]